MWEVVVFVHVMRVMVVVVWGNTGLCDGGGGGSVGRSGRMYV